MAIARKLCAYGGALVAAVLAVTVAIATPDFSHLPPQLQPHRPIIIRLINGIGSILIATGAVGLPTEEAAIDAACRAAKLPNGAECVVDDPEEATHEWRKGMRKLLESYKADANLTALGHLIASGQLETWLKARARLLHAWKALPAGTLGGERIDRPILVVGLPRTGTTFMLNLLSQDPALRAPLHWELVEPLPGEGEPPLGAAHIAKIQSLLDQFTQLLPGIEEVHPMEATMAEECVVTLAHEFSSMLFEATFGVKSYNEWLFARPSHAHAHAFRWHRKLLQFLQHRARLEVSHGPRRWVLKTPWYSHGPVLEAALAEYPDAHIVHTHRAPASIIGSSASVHAKTYGAGSDAIDLSAIGTAQAELMELMAASAMETRERWRTERPDIEARVADVSLAALKRDPLAVVERIYARFGMAFTAEARGAMEAWLQTRQVRHGGHSFELGSFGLDAEDIAARPVWVKYAKTFVLGE